MKFIGRLKYFGIGIGMGLVVVFAMFGTRGCDWTPTNRVKSAIQESRLATTEMNKCIMACNNITDDMIYDLVYNGKVNFKDSKTEGEPKNYILYSDDYRIGFDLNLKDSTAIVTDFYHHDKTCDCVKGEEKLIAINTPKAILFEKMIEKKIVISGKNNCEMKCHNLTEAEVRSIFNDGDIDYSLSVPNRKPNPGYAITKEFNGKTFLFAVEMGYNTRINTIKELGLESSCGC